MQQVSKIRLAKPLGILTELYSILSKRRHVERQSGVEARNREQPVLYIPDILRILPQDS